MKIYIVTEAQYLNGTASSFPTDDMSAYATAYKTDAAAIRGLRKMIRELVKAEYDGNDELMATINQTVKEIIDSKNGDTYIWEATDRSAVWRIISQNI